MNIKPVLTRTLRDAHPYTQTSDSTLTGNRSTVNLEHKSVLMIFINTQKGNVYFHAGRGDVLQIIQRHKGSVLLISVWVWSPSILDKTQIRI